MATFWQTPYFCVRLTALSPVTDLRSPSESDFLLDPVDLADDLRLSFGADAMRLANENLPVSEWALDAERGRLGVDGGCGEAGAVGGLDGAFF